MGEGESTHVSVLVTEELSGGSTVSSLHLEKKPVINVKQVILPPFVSVKTAEILIFEREPKPRSRN